MPDVFLSAKLQATADVPDLELKRDLGMSATVHAFGGATYDPGKGLRKKLASMKQGEKIDLPDGVTIIVIENKE